MKLLYKDQIQKIKQNLFQFISLSLIVMIISLTFTAVTASTNRLDKNYEPYLEQQEIEDFFFSIDLIDVEYLSGSTFTELCRALDLLLECGYAVSYDTPESYNELNILVNKTINENPEAYELFMDSYIDFFESEYDYIIEKQIVVDVRYNDHFYKFINLHETINLPYIVEGNLPVDENQVMIFDTYAKENNIEIGDSITIEDQILTITGFAYSPEFLFPIFSMNTVTFDPAIQTLVFAHESLIDQFPYDQYTRYVVQGDLSKIVELNSYQELQNIDRSAFGKYLQVVTIILPKDLNYRIITLALEIENAELFINMFMGTFIVFITLLILLFIKRYLHKYKKEIDILRSIGYKDSEIISSYMLFPLLISSSSIIGYLIGLLLSNQFFKLYSERYLFDKAGFYISIPLLLMSICIPILLIGGSSYVFIRKELRTKKKDQMIKHKLFSYMSLKSVVQFTILFLVVNTILLFGLNGNDMFTEFVDVTSVGNNYEELIQLRYFENEPTNDDIETFTRIPSTVLLVKGAELDNKISTTLYGIDSSTSLKALINNDIQNNLLLHDGIIISDYLKETLEVEIGDSITYKLGSVELTKEVVGVSNELIESNIFMIRDELNEYYGVQEGFYNALYVPDGTYEHPHVVSRINYTEGLQEFTSVLNISSLIVEFITVLSVSLGLSIFTVLIILYMTEHKKTIALLKAMGLTQKEIIIKLISPVILILLVTYVVSIPLTSYFLDLMLKSMMNIIGFKLILTINQVNVVIGLIFLLVLAVITIYFISRYNEKLSVSETLKSL